MYKLTMKNNSIVFMSIDEVCYFLQKKVNTLFEDGSYVKISFMEDI